MSQRWTCVQAAEELWGSSLDLFYFIVLHLNNLVDERHRNASVHPKFWSKPVTSCSFDPSPHSCLQHFKWFKPARWDGDVPTEGVWGMHFVQKPVVLAKKTNPDAYGSGKAQPPSHIVYVHRPFTEQQQQDVSVVNGSWVWTGLSPPKNSHYSSNSSAVTSPTTVDWGFNYRLRRFGSDFPEG